MVMMPSMMKSVEKGREAVSDEAERGVKRREKDSSLPACQAMDTGQVLVCGSLKNTRKETSDTSRSVEETGVEGKSEQARSGLRNDVTETHTARLPSSEGL